MTPPHGANDDPDAELDDDLVLLAGRLRNTRPAPSRAFESRLRDTLEAAPLSTLEDRPVRALVIGFAVAGTLLLAVGALITLL